jgi:hypothetical protein
MGEGYLRDGSCEVGEARGELGNDGVCEIFESGDERSRDGGEGGGEPEREDKGLEHSMVN